MGEVDQSGLFDAIMASAIDYAIIVVSPAGAIATWNAGAEKLFGYSQQEIQGQPMDMLFTEADRRDGVPEREMKTARERGRAPDVRWHQRKDGSRFWADGVLQPMLGTDGTLAGYVKILRDATHEHEYEDQIARLARTDPLTGLANRSAFAERFKDMTAAALRHGQCLVVHVIDLDYFKQVNDRHGHHVGDLLLKMVARRICHVVRDTDFVGRLGGDEFVVLQADAKLPHLGNTLAENLIEMLTQPFSIEGRDVRIGASIGITVFPQDDADPDQLLRRADLALYKVKNEGRNGYHYFSKELEELAYKRARALAAAQRAVANRDFSLVYQPIVAVATGKVSAVEALLRCHDRTLSQYPIEELIDVVVEAGLMQELGLWVLATACTQARRWQQAGVEGLVVGVNICAAEMSDPAFPDRVLEVLADAGLEPRHLLVEVTEHEILGPSLQQVLVDLRARGVQVALDDFGTGVSSLSYLTELQVDEIKLDGSFLRNVPEEARGCTIASAILGMAHGLQLSVVAEGVETAEQVDFIAREHCDLMQGYFFAPPLPPHQMTPWLLERVGVDLIPPELRGARGESSRGVDAPNDAPPSDSRPR